MNYVYKYTDLSDGVVKYVGIVCRKSDNALFDRIREHSENDSWTYGKCWKVEYICVETLNDANSLESHFIAKYKTEEWYNNSKTRLGLLSFLKGDFEWTVAEECLIVKEKETRNSFKDKAREILELKELMGRRLCEIEKSLKKIEYLLEQEKYDLYNKVQLIEDKKELERDYKTLLEFELSRPIMII